ncbi:LON peptidase substrate-binding domain-containing protein [Simiduia curdlanivorans]|uniref:LON peptidase substrate-binding domain-containing protein n=1 Tax=Simiduia curdlanivorans TaxID=1492769 RepID=A0ABV8V5Q7_9GAMM|nr:LON peptidase substrate-binding domain-containing protein [Simiduia curdlanivorans]MDN3640835.1 LON peptidase substrate-binding domain-containing protein [Simiduia curdlanivorans]
MLELPIFPLGQMPLPGIRFPMRIFERRYLDMISRQMRKDEGFVIAQAQPTGDFFPLAVKVAIVDWDQLPDGLLGITVQGVEVVHIEAHRVEDSGLIIGACQPVLARQDERDEAEGANPDTPDQSSVLSAHWDGLTEVLDQFKSHPGIAELDLPEADTAAALGWQLLQLLPVSAAERQKALRLTEQERLSWLAATLDRLSRE